MERALGLCAGGSRAPQPTSVARRAGAGRGIRGPSCPPGRHPEKTSSFAHFFPPPILARPVNNSQSTVNQIFNKITN